VIYARASGEFIRLLEPYYTNIYATLEFELIEQQVFETRKAAKMAIFEFIEVFYNRQRGHETLDYKTPLQVEQEYRLVA